MQVKTGKTSNIESAVALFAASLVKRRLNSVYAQACESGILKQAKNLDEATKTGLEILMAAAMAYASTKEEVFATSGFKKFLWHVAADAPSEISKKLMAKDTDKKVLSEEAVKKDLLRSFLAMEEKDAKVIADWAKVATEEEKAAMWDQLVKDIKRRETEVQPEGTQAPPPGLSPTKRATMTLRRINEQLEQKRKA